MPKTDADAAVAAAYRTINELDPAAQEYADKLRDVYKRVGEDKAVGEAAIDGMLGSGPGAAARLKATYEAVARLHHLDEE
jgi:hypothetical protein